MEVNQYKVSVTFDAVTMGTDLPAGPLEAAISTRLSIWAKDNKVLLSNPLITIEKEISNGVSE